jgi:anhydro-N-acetylmuramic acid kinase
MSGTSADGIDAALVEITWRGDDITVRQVAGREIPFDGLRDPILAAMKREVAADDLCLLNVALAGAYANASLAVAQEAGIQPEEVDGIGCHGQTLWHSPDPLPCGGSKVTGTLQAGSGPVLAAHTGCVVVHDFRSADMAWGGQGAPLVPLVDWLLFRSPERNRGMQNLGGIANATLLPAGGSLDDVLAFDTGPGNMVLDALAGYATGGRLKFDEGGALAAQGRVSDSLLMELLRDPYFARTPPKSTGRELFGSAYAEHLWRRGHDLNLSAPDLIATATALTAESVARSYRDFLPGVEEVILAGGGAKNPVLRGEIERRLAPIRVRRLEDLGWDSGLKEAVAFAVLADRTLQGLPGNVPRATGASRPVVLGSLSFPSPSA